MSPSVTLKGEVVHCFQILGIKNPAIQQNNLEDLNRRRLFYDSRARIVTIIMSFIITECVTMFFLTTCNLLYNYVSGRESPDDGWIQYNRAGVLILRF